MDKLTGSNGFVFLATTECLAEIIQAAGVANALVSKHCMRLANYLGSRFANERCVDQA